MDYKKLYLQQKREYLKHKHIIKGGSSGLSIQKPDEANETEEADEDDGHNSDSSNFSDESECNDPSYIDSKKYGDYMNIELVAIINDYEDRNKYLSRHLEECITSLKTFEQYGNCEWLELVDKLNNYEERNKILNDVNVDLNSKLEECVVYLKSKDIELEECIASLSSEEESYKTLYNEQREQIAELNKKILELEAFITKQNDNKIFEVGEK